MITADQRVIELAIQALETQQARIQQELTDLRRRLTSARPTALKATTSPAQQASARPAPNKGKPMSAAQKKKIAKAMKARWAKLRSGKAA
jgi:predicted  nucleic acid-binding Zn-ribbon protein